MLSLVGYIFFQDYSLMNTKKLGIGFLICCEIGCATRECLLLWDYFYSVNSFFNEKETVSVVK